MFEKFKDEQVLVYNIIKNSVENNKLSHAYLIDSNGYSSSLDFSIALAKYILSPDGNFEDNKDILELKVIQAEGQWIKKNQLEDLQNDFSKKAILGNKKVYIIDGAEKLNVSSSNSLLKFLEEPEDGIIAILITNNKYQLLDTIISRCQILKLNQISNSNSKNILESLSVYLFNNNEQISNYINNQDNMIKLEKIIEFVKYYEDNKLNTLCYINKLWNQYFSDKSDITLALNILMLFYKDVLNLLLNNEIQIFKEYVNDLKYVAEKNQINVIILKINVIMNLKEKIKFNINSNLLMDKLLIDLEGCENNA